MKSSMLYNFIMVLSFGLFLFYLVPCSQATKWQVGSTKTYTIPSAVAGKVNNGDTVEIDAGLYTGDCATWTKNNLILRGIGGMAHLDANGNSAGGKAIWVISGNNVTVEFIEFSGCHVVDQNGAGIRIEGTGITIRHCYFHDNEDGILGGSAGDVLVEYSEFSYNGYGDGYSHNIYINHVNSFTLQFCYMHHAKIGHEVKSRAHKNYILYNRITNEASGTASRNIDLPNGGLAIIIGNLIQKGPNTQNNNFLELGLEGLTNNPPHNLYVINNTFVNERGANGLFINTAANIDTLKVYNNIFTGAPYTFYSGSAKSLDTLTNLFIPDKTKAGFVNLSGYDYNLVSSSPAINKGSNPGMAGTYSLMPVFQYLHPSNNTPRVQYGVIDIGAYEYKPPTYIKDEVNSGHIDILDNKQGKIIFNITGTTVPFKVVVYDVTGKIIGMADKCNDGSYEWDYYGHDGGIYIINVWNSEKNIAKKFLLK